MKKMRNVIIILLILILVIAVILIVMLNQQKQDLPIMEEDKIPQDTKIELAKRTVKEENDYIFFTINDIIQKMAKEKDVKYYAQEMYKMQNYEYANYYIYGLIEKDSIEPYYLKMNIDYNNNTFKVENTTKEEYQKAKEGKIAKITQEQIEKSQNNSYEVALYNSREIAKRYIQDYLMKLQYSIEDSFSLLEEQYKNQKFKNIEEFKQYIQENNNRFTNFEIQSYKSEIKEHSREYTILDQLDKSYKIIVYDALNYKIILESV